MKMAKNNNFNPIDIQTHGHGGKCFTIVQRLEDEVRDEFMISTVNNFLTKGCL